MSRHQYRGERWHVLQDLGSGRFLRLNPAAYRLIVLMDGFRTVEEIWHQACMSAGDAAPSQEEVINLLTQLHQANLLISDRRPDLEDLQRRAKKTRRQKIKQYIANPLSIKLPLFDPDRLLGTLVGLVPQHYWKGLLAGWCLLILSAVVAGAYHWGALTHDLAVRAFTADNVLMLALLFPVLKLIHELGHGIAIKALGGNCREMGVMFLVFLPVPYVDASQTSGFPDKYRRMLVGAAGMMAEMSMAAVAFWLWSWSDDGVFKSMLHQTLVLAGVSTVMFNLNPLLRFDGYYILADWLEIPNLGNKANQYLGYLLLHRVFRSDLVTAPHLTAGERPWLVGYAIGSFINRILVAIAVIFTVGSSFFFIGVLLAAWAAWNMLLQPLVKQLRNLAIHPGLAGRRIEATAISSMAALFLMVVVIWVPAPSWTAVEGVVWLSEDARVRAPHPCFGDAVLVKPGAQVKAGEPLLSCSDPDLDAQIVQSKARVEELESRFALSAASEERVKMQMVQSDISHAREQLDDLQGRKNALSLASEREGEFQMAAPGDYPGRYLGRGEAVAYVIDPSSISLLAVVPQGDVDLVRKKTKAVELRVAGNIWQRIDATIRREVPAATRELPSLALSLAGGGKIGLDPQAAPGGEATALTPLFQFELSLADPERSALPGMRVYVRFVHDAEPLADQWYRNLRQVFLKRFVV